MHRRRRRFDAEACLRTIEEEQVTVLAAVPVMLGAGTQQITLLFDTGGMNISDFTVGAASGSSSPASAPPRRCNAA